MCVVSVTYLNIAKILDYSEPLGAMSIFTSLSVERVCNPALQGIFVYIAI